MITNRSMVIRAIDKYAKNLEENNMEQTEKWILLSCKADITYNKLWKESQYDTEQMLMELASRYENEGKKELATKVMKKAEEIENIIKGIV